MKEVNKMGFDLHGMNPVVRKGKVPVEPDGLWSKDVSEQNRNKYYDREVIIVIKS